jgi:hypothetical protein
MALTKMFALALVASASAELYNVKMTSGIFLNEITWRIDQGTTHSYGSGPSVQNIPLDYGQHTLTMMDSFGDGWNGATWSLEDSSGTVVVPAQHTTFTWGRERTVSFELFEGGPCGELREYRVELDCPAYAPVPHPYYGMWGYTIPHPLNCHGRWNDEISWNLNDDWLSTYSPSYSNNDVTYPDDVLHASTVHLCSNYQPTLNMKDSFRDGWNGVTWRLEDTYGNIVSEPITLSTGGAGSVTIAVIDLAAPTPAPTSPTSSPTQPTAAPTSPTSAPTQPTSAPTQPTSAPTTPTSAPTTAPTNAPTDGYSSFNPQCATPSGPPTSTPPVSCAPLPLRRALFLW